MGIKAFTTPFRKEYTMNIESYHTMKDEHDYHFYGKAKRKDELYMGFELEVDMGDDVRYDDYRDNVGSCTDDLYDLFDSGYLHFEDDGSLDNGFEMITQPASVSHHLSLFDDGTYAKMCRICNDYGFRSHDIGTCGLHIHLDKEYFGDKLDSASAKLLFLFERHWDNLKKFSRRRDEHWCHRYLNPSDNWFKIDSIKSVISAAKNRALDRYYAVNLSNYDTIEIRLWRGTLNPATLKATIKLTARLAQLAKETPAVKLAAMSWMDILGDDEDILTYARIRGLVPENDN